MTTSADPLPHGCAAVCVFGNGMADPDAMRCHRTDGAIPMLLAEMRKPGMPCGPEAALMTFRTSRQDSPAPITQHNEV